MLLKVLPEVFAVCKLEENTKLDLALFDQHVFLARTDTELSLVCRQEDVPAGAFAVEANWRALQIAGQLDFSLIGILAGIAQILAQNQISIFVVSTYDTDYILVKAEQLEQALTALTQNGYLIEVNS